MEWQRYEFRVSTDPRLLQFAVIHDFLRQTYWANEISESVLKKALDGSLCFGLYQGERQIGLARVALLINFLILIFCQLFIYGFIFLEILYFNLFSILVLFIIKFKIAVYKLKKSTKDEE